MSLRRLRAMFVKELHHITRDPLSLGIALAVPFMMLLLYGYALSLDVDHIPTMIYDQDRSPASRELISHFAGSKYFEIRGFAEGYEEVEHGIERSGQPLPGARVMNPDGACSCRASGGQDT